MIIYEYLCLNCLQIIEEFFIMGQAAESIVCVNCKSKCNRYYGNQSFCLKGDGWPGKTIKNDNPSTIQETEEYRIKNGFKPLKDIKVSDEDAKARNKRFSNWADSTKK